MATRLRPATLLEHPLREALIDQVRSDPGVAFLDLWQRMRTRIPDRDRLGYGNLSYHLGLLEKNGYLTSRRAGRYRRFYENGGVQGRDTTALSVLQTEPMPVLADLLLRYPGLTQHALWTRFVARTGRACSRQTVAYHLGRLERAGLVVVGLRGRAKRHYATETVSRLFPMVLQPAAPSAPPAARTQEPVGSAAGAAADAVT